MLRLFLLALAALVASAGVPTPERWMDHLTRELLPFWDVPDALGSPVGSFPTIRCDDGRLYSRNAPCPEVRNSAYATMDRQYAVSLSRQTYGYGVAFHMTGDPKYLRYMKAGVDYLRANVYDRQAGGSFAYYDGPAKSWQPAPQYRNPQELAYAMLGTAFYYYLTHDPEVLPDLLAAKEYVFANYYNPGIQAFQWMLADQGTTKANEKRIVATLDQMNAYMVMLAPILPEPHASDWKRGLFYLSRILTDQFYSPDDNLFFTASTTPRDRDLAVTPVDFGHTIKSFWMIRWTGLMTGDQELVRFAEENGPRVLERAWLEDTGSWARAVTPQGIDRNKEWWIYAELDQFAATMALKDRSMEKYLERSSEYWFEYLVDHAFGEVWTTVDGTTNRPLTVNPKQWPWKNAYHSLEHALVGYITSSALHGRQVPLYFALNDWTGVRPYFFEGDIESVDTVDVDSVPVTRVVFSNIR